MNLFRRIAGKVFHLFCQAVTSALPVKGRVLMLHNIGSGEPRYTISEDEFDKLLRFLQKEKVIRLEDWEQSDGFYAITFDDVSSSFFSLAFPKLVRYGLPFTIFVNLSLLDTEGFITTENLLEIVSCPLCTLGSHGMSHGEFAKLTSREALVDLTQSKERLESLTGRKVELYAFPYGSFYACGYRNKRLVKKVYRNGFGTVQCPVTAPSLFSGYFLPRMNVDSDYIKEL